MGKSSSRLLEKERRETLRGNVRTDREQCFEEWSGWMLVVSPGIPVGDLPEDINNNCGIYEFAIKERGRGNRKKYPVYLGSTCICDNQICANEGNCGLRTRISEHVQLLSHKHPLFIQAIIHRMKIYVKIRKVCDSVHGWQQKKKEAREAENYLLHNYDYAWNIRRNGPIDQDKPTPRSVRVLQLKRETLTTEQEATIAIAQTLSRWSIWKMVMGPEQREGTENRMPQSLGYMLSDLTDIEDECGIYEFAIQKSGQGNNPMITVYLGSTCKCTEAACGNRNCGLRTRISLYCQDGNHKHEIINRAIQHGMVIYVRTKAVRADEMEAWEERRIAAREAENSLLQNYDYAWNLRENNKTIPRSVIDPSPLHNQCPFCFKIGL